MQRHEKSTWATSKSDQERDWYWHRQYGWDYLGQIAKHTFVLSFLHFFLYLSYFNICSTPSSFLPTGVKLDPSKAWCPVLECQAVCSLQPSTEGRPTAVPCLTCHAVFCSGCRGPWQDGHTCPERQPMMSPSPSHESRSVRRPLTAATQLRVFVRTKPVTAVNKLLT